MSSVVSGSGSGSAGFGDWRHPSLARALLAVSVLSLLFSFLAWLLHDNINHDGVKFVDAAVRFQQEGLAGAFEVYRWPAYSVLIGILSWMPGISPAIAAHLINAGMLVLLCTSFVMICREVYGAQPVLAGAVVVILALPAVNEYRDYIIRDLANWSMLTFAFWQLFRFLRLRDWRSATLWQLGLLGAFLFKMEAIAFAVLAPVFFLFTADPVIERARNVLKLSWLGACGLLVLLGLSTFMREAADISRAGELLHYLQLERALSGFEHQVELLSTHVLNAYTRSYAEVMWLGSLCGLLVYKVLTKMGAAHACMLLLLRHNGMPSDSQQKRLLIWLISVATLILVVFVFQRFYIAGRYPAVLTILLSVALAGVVQRVVLEPAEGANGWLRGLLILLLVYAVLDPFVQTGPRKTFLRESGAWVQQELGGEARLFSNYAALYFYSGRTAYRSESDMQPFDLDHALNSVRSYDYLLLAEDRLSPAQWQALQDLSGVQQIRRFGPADRNGVVLFSVRPAREE